MAANGISTLPNKEHRKIAKINLAAIKRQAVGTFGYRVLNYYVGTVSPTPGRPWSTFAPVPSGAPIVLEDSGAELYSENGENIVTE